MADFLGILVIYLLLSYLVGRLARAKGYSFAVFFILSMLGSPIAGGMYLKLLPRRARHVRRPPPAPQAQILPIETVTPPGHSMTPAAAAFDQPPA
jgi:hypothetical protein